MRANRRRPRKSDPLANPEAIRLILARLRELLPEVIPKSEKQLIKMLNAVRNVERRPASDTRRGRPSHWKRPDLIRVANHLRHLLDRETQGRVSLNSFISLYLRVLNFPEDILKGLVSGDINLFEAAQLARLIPERLHITSAMARSLRAELLHAHLMAQGSEARLRARVNESFGERVLPTGKDSGGDLGIGLVDDLVEIDPYDARHMFWEELRRIAFALHNVTPEDIDDKILEDFLSVSDQLSCVLARVEKRRQHRESQYKQPISNLPKSTEPMRNTETPTQ